MAKLSRKYRYFLCIPCPLLLFSNSVLSNSLWPHGLKYTSLSFSISQSLLKLMSIELVMPSNHLILCHPLLLPSIFPSIRVFLMSQFFASGGQSIGVSSFSISPSDKYSGLISFRMDWFWLPCHPQGTLKSLIQNHSSKASVFWHSAFFTAQLSHPYMTIGKTIALTTELCLLYNFPHYQMNLYWHH